MQGMRECEPRNETDLCQTLGMRSGALLVLLVLGCCCCTIKTVWKDMRTRDMRARVGRRRLLRLGQAAVHL